MKSYRDAEKLLKEKGQEQLLAYYDLLSANEQEELIQSIFSIDWQLLQAQNLNRSGNVEPLWGLSLKEIAARRKEYEEEGIRLLRSGKAGAVMLAGGQGTRLGSSAPKGAFDMGLKRPLYIFECLINNLKAVTEKYGVRAPLLIMTSDKNDASTRKFLKEHGFFGYPAEDVYFFKQDMAPCTDLTGKILLEERGRLALSPNGNGGWFSSLMRAGLVEKLRARGVEYLNVFAVDNVLQRILDPVFLGATHLSKMPCGAKTVKKNAPDERVGVLCKRDGLPDVIEYYELSEELQNARDSAGELLYGNGVILNYLFSVSALEQAAGCKIPVHRAKKKVPYFNGKETVAPQTENAYKYETLVIDLVHLMRGCLSFEVEREREFAPVKNPTGIDSVESARILLQKNGVEL